MADYSHREKKRRHLALDNKCPICREHAKTTLHALRDCSWIKPIWKTSVFPHSWEDFFSKSTMDWVDWNLTQDGIGAGGRVMWQLTFQIMVYHAWRARNKFAIEGENYLLKVPSATLRQMAEQAKQLLFNGRGRVPKQDCLIRWISPPEGVVKVNVDGASERNPGRAGVGGLIRDETGIWLGGFAESIGNASNIAAELWGILKGMQLAWGKGYRDVIVETDSKVGLEMIEDAVATSPYHNLVKQIRSMMSREWSCKLQHIWRGGNRCADWLAKEAIQLQLPGGLMEEPPTGLREMLGADIIGVTTPRLVQC